jgi:membrane-associated phospholipid phosphatase
VSSDEPAVTSRQETGGVITHGAARLTALASSISALGAIFYGLLELDLPIVRYVRSVTIHLPWDQLTIPWMAFTSNAGDWIGEGSHLVALSLLLLATGWWLSRPAITTAGIQTLLAHGIAALVANIVKHLLGRPRPKFVHSGEWQFTPSWASGLDSFPSGHTTASFAVATVLAKRFPGWAPLCFALAAFVGLSRVLRGSHFPTDVLGGAVMGMLSGSLASAPWKGWRDSLEEGLRHAAIGMAAAFAVLWTFTHDADEGITGTLLLALGVAATASGVWLRRGRWMNGALPADEINEKLSRGLIAYGLAAMTTAPLVVASVAFTCVAYWFHRGPDARSERQPSQARAVLAEGVLLAGVLLALTVVFSGRGLLPFR